MVRELGLLLGVGRTRVRQLAALPPFPAPVERLMMGAVWQSADVDRWAADTGRTLNYDALDVLPREVGQPGDGWLVTDGGAEPVVIVEVDPVG